MWTEPYDPAAGIIWIVAVVQGPMGFLTANMVLDTGSPVTILSPTLTDRLGYSPRMGLATSRLLGIENTQQGYRLPLFGFDLMGLSLKNVVIHCHDVPDGLGVHGLIGMDLFAGRILTINGIDATITLCP